MPMRRILPMPPRTGAPEATVTPSNQQQHVDRPYNSVISAASVNSQTDKMYWKMQNHNLINYQQAQAATAAQAAAAGQPSHEEWFMAHERERERQECAAR